jgi:ubiquinone/menaquinone biosynthesis C-methylase UbiE
MNKFAELYDDPAMLDAFETNHLEWPEVMLLNEMAGRDIEMLDIGIGAGRTSVFFLPVVKRYVGVDISSGMIGRSRKRIKSLDTAAKCELRVSGASTLRGFNPGSFDVVLFSLNGMDCIPVAERDDCIKAMMRVLRPGGRLVYSAHNIRYIGHYYRFRGPRGPLRRIMRPRTLMNELNRLRVNKAVNGPLEHYLDVGQAEFWDAFHDGRPDAKHVHIKPEFEVFRLESLGLVNVTARSRTDGRVISGAELCSNTDPWVYFFSNMPAQHPACGFASRRPPAHLPRIPHPPPNSSP